MKKFLSTILGRVFGVALLLALFFTFSQSAFAVSAGPVIPGGGGGGGGGGGAPTDASYVTVSSNGDLSAERVLTGTSNQITVSDGGSTVTLATPQNIHTAATPQFGRMGLGVAADANRLLLVSGDVAGGVATINRSNSSTSAVLGTAIIKGTSTGDMADGFGTSLAFAIQDTAGVENSVAYIAGIRNGADNTGYLSFVNYVAGVATSAMQLNNAGLVLTQDDQVLSFGATGDYGIRWETADANSNEILYTAPEGGATDVPIHVFGDASAVNVDLGFFNGMTAPGVAVLSDDHASYVLMDHDETNARILTNEGDLTLTLPGGNLIPSANDAWALGVSGTGVSDIFLASGAVINFSAGDVLMTHSSDNLAFTGGQYTFDNLSQFNKSTGGIAVDVNYTANTYNTGTGIVDIVQSTAFTGVAAETFQSLRIVPSGTLTEPSSGTFNYNGAMIDMSSMPVTAGTGSSIVAGLSITAGTDADAGANLALNVVSGRSNFGGPVVFGANVATVSTDVSIGRESTNEMHFNIPSAGLFEFAVTDVAEFTMSNTTLDMRSNDLRWTANGSVTASATQIVRSSGFLNYNNGTGAVHRFSLNNVSYFEIADNSVTVVASRLHTPRVSVASANDITLPSTANKFSVSGTTTINTISGTGWTSGDTITLHFDSSLTVNDETAGTGAQIRLATSTFSATANDNLVLEYDGTFWDEISRVAL